MTRNTLIVIALAALVGIAGYYVTNTTNDAPVSLSDTDTQNLSMVVVNVPADLSAKAMSGKVAFDLKCAACHGGNGAGQDGVAPPLIHKIYEPSHHGDEAFQRAAKLGVRSHHWFTVCGLFKRVSDLSVRGHGSLRGRVLRLMMVFGGGSSPMSFAGYVAVAASQPFLRDRSTSVPLELRFPPVRQEFSSGCGLLCPLIVGS